MAALAGRKVRISTGGSDFAGARVDSVAINREHIDVTDKDDSGVRKLLDEIGTHSVELTCSGIIKDDTLLDWAADPTDVLKTLSFEVETIGTLSGSFGLSSFNVGGNDGAEGATFEASFASAGVVTYTAAT
jgi:predicted secreted protein